jgi:hypothetical protein
MKQRIAANIPRVVLPLLLISLLTVLLLLLSDSISVGAIALLPRTEAADEPACDTNGSCLDIGDFSPVSMNAEEVPPDAWAATYPSAPAFGALVYDPDFRNIEEAAREKLRRGLDARVALSPYKGNVEFETYVKQFDYEAGWNREYTGLDPYGDTLTLIDLINRVDQDLREARDLYAYLAVYAPEHRFRADGRYVTDQAPPEYSDYWGATQTLCGNPEDPDPEDPAFSGQVLPPVIDWCNFPARLRQSVREAAHLRLLFGQQFMVDAMGLHFSGVEFYGGEPAVREELAQMRAAKHQYELAEQGLVEALGRAVGSGCYVSDFYRQPEWSLLSRAMENQETAQHEIATRLSYLDIDSPEEVPQIHAAARDAFRQASTEGYIRLIGMASLGAAQPLGVGCDVGERPDGLLAAEMAANLLETRRRSREMADGRNVFGFDVTFTPARPFKNTDFQTCEATGPGQRGLWDEAWCAAEYAKELQNDEVDNTRAFDDSQAALLDEIDEIREGIDARIVTVSGCSNAGDVDAWYACVSDQIDYLVTCNDYVTDTVEYEEDMHGRPIPTQPIDSEFDKCMKGVGYPVIKDGEAKQALLDLRSVYVGYTGIISQAQNINDRVQESKDRNATVTRWLWQAGTAQTVADVVEAGLLALSCVSWDKSLKGTAIGCGVGGVLLGTARGFAGHESTQADVEIENADHHQEVQNLLLDMSELLIDAYAAQQQFFSKKTAFEALLEGMESDLLEAQRQRAYFLHSPANDPSYRMVRDSSRMVLAKQMEYAARMAYLAARRAEYEYAARLSASNFRISDIYRARTADDIKRYLQQMRNRIDNLPGGVTNARDLTVSVAQHVLLLTDEALAKEGYTDPAAAQAERVRRFRLWVADKSFTPSGGEPVLRFNFPTSLLEGGLFSDVILQNYDGYWLHKLAGIGEPWPGNNGVVLNLVTEQTGLSFRETSLAQGGTVHLRSQAGCIYDYKLIAPAFLLGLEWASNQDPEVATASFKANVNGTHDWTENGFRAPEFLGRGVSSTNWEVLVFSGAPEVGLPNMDLQQLTDIELVFSTTYASRTPGEPELSECTRIDW